MAGYSIRITKSAAKEIEALGTKKDRQRIVSRIRALADDPRPPGVEKLSGSRDRYRIRKGDFRILDTIEDEVLVITVIRVADRKDAYRRT